MTKYFSESGARRFYDRVGRLEDTQAFYEDPALDKLMEIGGFETASSVFEFGCGTGRLAERLLEGKLADGSTYLACDISPKMVELAQSRLARFGHRATVIVASGDPVMDMAQHQYDRIVTTYVLDLLAPEKIGQFLASASERLKAGGLLCAASIAPGKRWPSKAIMRGWSAINSIAPILTGGCRPIELERFLHNAGWSVRQSSRISAWGVTSQILTASHAAGAASTLLGQALR